jgi:hypothetical protein
MHKLSSTFGGIGTGAGVAWPLFGIISSALSLGIGGVAAISFGCVCGVLFLAVSIPVFYILYKKSKQEQMKLNEKLNLTFSTFLNIMDSNSNEYGPLHIKLIHFLKKRHPILFDNIHLTKEEKQKILKDIRKNYISCNDIDNYIPPLPASDLRNTAFLSFVAVFGSIAGCIAGLMGVFVIIGVISGFGAVPLLAAFVLATAIGFGIFAAVQNTQSERENHRKIQIHKHFKKFNQDFIEQNRNSNKLTPSVTPKEPSSKVPYQMRGTRFYTHVHHPEHLRHPEDLRHAEHLRHDAVSLDSSTI